MADKAKEDDFEFEVEDEGKAEIEVQDDTPLEDRGRTPLPKEIVDELEADELEEYSEKVKVRLKQFKKAWHDERREKEREGREKQEALEFAKKSLEEAKRLRETLTKGEETLLGSIKQTAELEAAAARKEYREAHDLGDSEKLLAAQEKLTQATYKLEQVKTYKPTLQAETPVVEQKQESVTTPKPDAKTTAWQERNVWFGTDEEMTASALGLHQKLVKQHGPAYASTDEYWRVIDDTMRRRFPEYYGEDKTAKPTARAETKPATVVASASRSTSSKKIVLKQSQLAIAKRLGITPEQYAREMAKLEA